MNITEQVRDLTEAIVKREMKKHRIIEHYEEQREMFKKKKEQAERNEDWTAYEEAVSCHRLCEEFIMHLLTL